MEALVIVSADKRLDDSPSFLIRTGAKDAESFLSDCTVESLAFAIRLRMVAPGEYLLDTEI